MNLRRPKSSRSWIILSLAFVLVAQTVRAQDSAATGVDGAGSNDGAFNAGAVYLYR